MMSTIKTILRNPVYTGTAYAIEYFIFFSIIPIITFSIINNYGLILPDISVGLLLAFGGTLAVLIFFQKALRRSHIRLSGVSGIARYFASLVWVYVIASMLSSIWIYGSLWQFLQGATTWATVDYSFIIWLVLFVFLIRFVRYGYQIVFAKDLQGEKGVETLEEEIREEMED